MYWYVRTRTQKRFTSLTSYFYSVLVETYLKSQDTHKRQRTETSLHPPGMLPLRSVVQSSHENHLCCCLLLLRTVTFRREYPNLLILSLKEALTRLHWISSLHLINCRASYSFANWQHATKVYLHY
jgi:hypothetical protein